MTFTVKPLADGQLANAEATIFTCTAKTYVKQITIFNTNALEQTIFVLFNVSGTARKMRRFVLQENESADVLDGAMVILLESGDLIRAFTTTAAAVDYLVWGVEET